MSTVDLPSELISKIAENLTGDYKALLAISLLSHRWRDASRHVLFTSVNVTSPYRFQDLFTRIHREPQISPWIHRLQLGRLGDLTFTPVDHGDWIQMTIVSQPPIHLPALKTLQILSLSFHDTKAAMDAFIKFSSQVSSIQSLEITNCRLHFRLITELVAHLHNLEKLTVRRCRLVYSPCVGEVKSHWDTPDPRPIATTQKPRIRTLDVSWCSRYIVAARLLSDLRRGGYLKHIKTIILSSRSGDETFLKDAGCLLGDLGDGLEELTLQVTESHGSTGLALRIPQVLNLNKNSNLRRLSFENTNIALIHSIVQTLDNSRIPNITINVDPQFANGLREDVSEEDSECTRLDELIAKSEQDSQLTLRIASSQYLTLVQECFSRLHRMGLLRIEDGRELDRFRGAH